MLHAPKIWLAGITLLILAPLGCKQESTTTTGVPTDTNTTAPADMPAEAPADTATAETTQPETVPQDTTAEPPAGPEKLTIGAVAPRLEIAQWVQGDEVDGFVPGHTYVVEFWATWCGPCRAGMPHIANLQKEHEGDVTFIGITAEDEDTVEGFLDKTQNEETGATWREVVTYTLALDAARATNSSYMKAAGQNGIPCAFIVGPDAHIEWIGHPARIDEPLEHLVAGTWNRDEFLARYEQEQRAKEAMQRAMMTLRKARQSGDWDKAIAAIDALIEESPEQTGYQQVKFGVLLEAKRVAEAATLAEVIAEDYWDQPQPLNSFAWSLVTQPSAPDQVLDVALRIAKRASELENDENAATLDTLARVYFEQGNLDQAIACQEKAVALDGSAEGLAKTLEQYQAARDGEGESVSDGDAEGEGDAEDEGDALDEADADTEVTAEPEE